MNNLSAPAPLGQIYLQAYQGRTLEMRAATLSSITAPDELDAHLRAIHDHDGAAGLSDVFFKALVPHDKAAPQPAFINWYDAALTRTPELAAALVHHALRDDGGIVDRMGRIQTLFDRMPVSSAIALLQTVPELKDVLHASALTLVQTNAPAQVLVVKPTALSWRERFSLAVPYAIATAVTVGAAYTAQYINMQIFGGTFLESSVENLLILAGLAFVSKATLSQRSSRQIKTNTNTALTHEEKLARAKSLIWLYDAVTTTQVGGEKIQKQRLRDLLDYADVEQAQQKLLTVALSDDATTSQQIKIIAVTVLGEMSVVSSTAPGRLRHIRDHAPNQNVKDAARTMLGDERGGGGFG
jgi:hypothetical protein